MASKHTPDQSRKPAPGDKSAKGKGELASQDLDKVAGGMAARPGAIGNIKEPLAGG